MRATRRAAFLVLLSVFCTTPAAADSIGWPQPHGSGTPVVLTYSISNLFDGSFNARLSPAEIRQSTAQAFAIWARYAPLHFHEVRDAGPAPGEFEYRAAGLPDIRIGYMPVLPGGAVAHAHLPYEADTVTRSGLAGDIHFSNDVSGFNRTAWGAASEGSSNLDFFSAMLHEIGHSLGLPHIFDARAVMGNVFLVFLHMEDADLLPADIAAIRAVYGFGVGSVHLLDRDPIVPEPATIILIATGLGLAARRRIRSAHPR